MVSLDFLYVTEEATCMSCIVNELLKSLVLHNQFKQKMVKSHINSIAELASGRVVVSDKKQVALQFASYVSKSETGLVKLPYFGNITNKCGLLVTRQKNDNIFSVKYIDKHTLPQRGRRFFIVCFCSCDKGVQLFVAMVVNISSKQQQHSLKTCFFLFPFKTSLVIPEFSSYMEHI